MTNLTQQYEAFVNMRELDYIFGLEVISDNESLHNMRLSTKLCEIIDSSIFFENIEQKTDKTDKPDKTDKSKKKATRSISKPKILRRPVMKKIDSSFDALYKVDPNIFYNSFNS